MQNYRKTYRAIDNQLGKDEVAERKECLRKGIQKETWVQRVQRGRIMREALDIFSSF